MQVHMVYLFENALGDEAIPLETVDLINHFFSWNLCVYDSHLFIFLITENGFAQHDMALMLSVSKRTVENRMAEFNLTNENRFSDIDDSSLDAYTERIIGTFPRSGTVSALLCKCITTIYRRTKVN